MTAERSRSPRGSARSRLATAAAGSILERIDTVVSKARARILDEEPAYQHLSEADVLDVTGLLYSNFRMLAAAMAGQRVSREQLDYVGEHVRKRVRTGIPLEDVIEAYRLGMNVFWEECTAEVAARGLSRDAAVELARKMSEAMDTLTTHAAAAYVREESYLRAIGEKAARELVDALLRGDVDPARLETHSAAPGLDPQADLVVVVGRVSVADSTLTRALETAGSVLADALATRRASPLLVVRERAVVAIVPAEGGDQRLARLTGARNSLKHDSGIELYCGVSSPCEGFGGVAGAFEQASLAVSRASEERPVVSLAALPALQHLLIGATGTTRAQLADKARVLLDLSPNARAVLKQTLTAYARADMNVTRAAADLLVHENTLRYRLRRIRQHSGHDPRSFAGLVELICLLEILDGDQGAHDGAPAGRARRQQLGSER